MVSSTERFGQAKLKLIWANQHISQFHALWRGYLESDFCKVSVKEDPKTGSQSLWVESLEPTPAELVLLTGDAIHNLKSALDYVIGELLGWRDTRLTFPMAETREELVSSFSTNGIPGCPHCGRGAKGKGRNAAIEIAVPGIGQFIANTIRPYKAANGFLWPINKLDVRDKHRLLIPVIIPQTVTGICLSDNNNNVVESGTVKLMPDGVVNFAEFGHGGMKVDSYGKATAEIFFNEVGIIEGQAVLPALINMSQAVAETIGSITEFVDTVRPYIP